VGAACGYFSVLPVSPAVSAVPPDPDALAALPLVGAVLGGLAGGGAALCGLLVPHAVAAALALGLLVALSGAIHLDGFLDGCDAFFAGVAPGRRLAILKDPRCGSFALAGLLVTGLLTYASLAVLPVTRYPELLAFSGALARAAAVVNALLLPPARPAGDTADADGARVSRALETRPPAAPLVFEILLLAVAAFAITPYASLLVPAALVLSLAGGRWIAGRLGGGLVGDAYGFLIVLLETVILTALTAVLP
jgi:adenosylcobinamide-GDP ribazoletransferase